MKADETKIAYCRNKLLVRSPFIDVFVSHENKKYINHEKLLDLIMKMCNMLALLTYYTFTTSFYEF